MDLQKMVAEFIGTFTLVFIGCGAAVFTGAMAGGLAGADAIGITGISLAFGLALIGMAYGIGPISGCHINPAVSLGAMVAGRMSIGEMIQYWIGEWFRRRISRSVRVPRGSRLRVCSDVAVCYRDPRFDFGRYAIRDGRACNRSDPGCHSPCRHSGHGRFREPCTLDRPGNYIG